MDKQVQESLLEIKFTIEALEKQIKYLNRLSAEEGYSDDLIEQRLNMVTGKLVELEHTVKKIEFQIEEIEEHSPTYEASSKKAKTRSGKREEEQEGEEEAPTLTWPLIVTIIVSVISFLAGPIIEIIKYLLK